LSYQIEGVIKVISPIIYGICYWPNGWMH
jgi:hypothetical protein